MKKSIYILILIFPVLLFGKCRNCDIVIDTLKTVEYEKFISDTFLDIDGKKVTLSAFLDTGSNIIVVIRVGDRPAWIRTSIDVAKNLSRKCKNISLFFLLLDTDSQTAKQTFSALKYEIKTDKFRIFYTDKYIDSENSIKIARWRLEATPAIIVYSSKKSVGKMVFYPVFFNAMELTKRISDEINCK